jgi:hypothetical protein
MSNQSQGALPEKALPCCFCGEITEYMVHYTTEDKWMCMPCVECGEADYLDAERRH